MNNLKQSGKKSWRPENWEKQKYSNEGSEWMVVAKSEAYEAGADAVLNALRKRGIRAENIQDLRYPESDTITIPTLERMKEMKEIKGHWVFIPDEDENAKQ